MTWNNGDGKKVYLSKLEQIIQGIDKILTLKANHVITPERIRDLQHEKDTAALLLSKLQTGEFEIAVVGLEKAGKSSFSNALIGLNVLPTDDKRCTYTSTCIRSGSKSTAMVSFYTREEFDRDFNEKLEKLGITDTNSNMIGTLSLNTYKQLYERCPQEKKCLYEDTLNQDIQETIENKEELLSYIGQSDKYFTGEELKSGDFQSFITEPGRAIAVKNVTICSTELKEMPNAVMYDVPGFNSPTQMHQEQTLQKMASADAIIMVAKADEPSITGDVLQIFKKFDEDGVLLSDKLFVFANKADRAVNLEKNKEVTFEEWINKRKILPHTAKERIIFGSANAHLGENTPNGVGMKARKDIEQKGISDGIDELREKLQVYYETTRFEVLKKRIDKIWSNFEHLIDDLKEECKVGTGESNGKEYSAIALNLSKNLKSYIKPKLEELKNRLNVDSRTKHPLMHEITQCLQKLVTTDEFGITEENIRDIHMEIAGVGGAQQPQKLDGKIRESRFTKMYDAFTKAILECTGSEHGEVCESIREIFRQALHIERNTDRYNTLENNITRFCQLDTANNDDYYLSLTERFARDLFEVQIKFSLGKDRLNKFREEATNLLSLGVFYDVSQATEEEKAVLAYNAQDSLFWRILLYPELADTDTISQDDIIAKFQQMTGLNNVNNTLKDLLNQLRYAAGCDTMKTLENLLIGVVFSAPEAALLSTLKERLTNTIQSLDGDSPVLLKEVLYGNRYGTDIAQKHENYEYETVQKEFDLDIRALQLTLRHAFLPAVDIDKAFRARESKLIEDIIQKIGSEDSTESQEFIGFIVNNIDIIAAEKLSILQEKEQQHRLLVEEMNAIQTIYDKMKQLN